MTRPTTLSLLAAAAFGLVMAAASAASSEQPDHPSGPERENWCFIARTQCIQGCFNNSNTPEDRAGCETRCNAQLPADCRQELRQTLGAARITTPARTAQRRP